MDTNIDYNTVAIPTDTPELEAMVGSKFARSAYYAIYNHDSLEFTFVKNDSVDKTSAGTKAAKQLIQLGIHVVLVPDIGMKAFKTLEKANINVYKYYKSYSVRDAIYELFEDQLSLLTTHTVND